MERRLFIHLTAAGALGLALPGAASLSSSPSTLEALAHPELLELFGDHQTVREIGLNYRAQFAEESNLETLVAALTQHSGLSGKETAAGLPRRLKERVRKDFEDGQTLQLGGWILSMTEARQSALFSLLFA